MDSATSGRRTDSPARSGTAPAAATAVGAALSVVSLWWTVPTVIAAFLAGRRPGRTGPTAPLPGDRSGAITRYICP